MQSKHIINVLENEEAKSFIIEHIKEDVASLALQYAEKVDFNLTVCLQLIAIYKKAQKKTPVLVQHLLAVDQRSYEQCTATDVAKYKSTFIRNGTMLDMTAGLGVDSIYLAPGLQKITGVEQNAELHQIASYNFSKLAIKNVIREHGSGEKFLNKMYDWVYIDPDRRSDFGRSVALQYLSPNVLDLLPRLRQFAKRVYIKLSPLFDVDEVWRNFEKTSEVHVIADRGEIKEVGVLLDMTRSIEDQKVVLCDVQNDFKAEISRNRLIKGNAAAPHGLAEGRYLLYPNSLILKSKTAAYFLEKEAYKKHPNFELYFCDNAHFQGFRVFTVLSRLSFSKKEIRKNLAYFEIKKVNIIIKGSTDKPADWHKKFGTKDGGEYYMFVLSDNTREVILGKYVTQN